MKITVEVTAENIAAGGYYCGDCPIALAMIDAGYVLPTVSRRAASWQLEVPEGPYYPEGLYYPQRESAPLPVAVVAWVRAYDRGFPVKPFSFELECCPEDEDTES